MASESQCVRTLAKIAGLREIDNLDSAIVGEHQVVTANASMAELSPVQELQSAQNIVSTENVNKRQ